HNGNLKIAKKLVSKAKEIGADAIKFQTFKADDLASKNSKFFKLFKKLELSYNDFAELSDHAKSSGIIFFSTPFSNKAVDLLDKLNVPAFKIASGDLTNIPLIRYISAKMKPVILSTGMADMNEVNYAVRTINSINKKIIILHSVSAYPTPTKEVNLSTLDHLKQKFPYPIGYSDNGSDDLVPLAAIARGAKLIEKHFTLDNKLKGPDHSLSADPNQFQNLIKNIRIIEEMLGDGIKKCQPSELKNKVLARRSITANTTIGKNSIIRREMIGIKRPATGIEPRFLSKVLGKRAKRTIQIDSAIKWSDIG
ncbi:MAG: N-acetylneuraminate synthase family protein, partial [Candidatus Paceibacterota bacterium]